MPPRLRGSSRLARGRSYVRNGSVLDLQVAPGKVTALVSGSSLYKVAIDITRLSKKKWDAIRIDCAGGIDSLVALLQGKLSKALMERLCRQDAGLFPKPSEIRFSCSCPDHASMCKHVSATLYGIGARLDHKPELLFRLRAVDETELTEGIHVALPISRINKGSARILEGGDLSALFGLDMAVLPATAETDTVQADADQAADGARPPRPRRATPAPKRALPKVKVTAARKRGPSIDLAVRPRATRRDQSREGLDQVQQSDDGARLGRATAA